MYILTSLNHFFSYADTFMELYQPQLKSKLTLVKIIIT